MAPERIKLRAVADCPNETLLQCRIRELLQHDIPGFLISRSSLACDRSLPPNSLHAYLSGLIKNILRNEPEFATHRPRRAQNLSGGPFTGLGQERVGEWHHDRNGGLQENSRPVLHTTLSGGGQIFLAGMGYDPETAGLLPHFSEMTAHPHNLLLRGLANPALTATTIYTASLSPGDSVVFKEEGVQATWHRFDTDPLQGLRMVAVTSFSAR